MSQLFIPEKIRVGFQKREGTYTKRLAYVIYYDAAGILRKKKSWEQWRDKDIEPEEFDNKPQDGFHINKGVQRFNWSHFGSDRSYIRIFDSRGIEFEVTPDNLIGLLMETDCLKRGFQGKFVYAWCGPELVLLPCSSEDYIKALANTKRQGQKISARALKPGCSYTTKKGDQVIYMGWFLWFSWSLYKKTDRISKKKHVFAHPTNPEYGNKFFPKSDATFLAVLNSEEPVQNYAELVDEFNGDIHSSVIEKWETRPVNITSSVFDRTDDGRRLVRNIYTSMKGDEIVFWHLSAVIWGQNSPDCDKLRGYRFVRMGTLDTKKLIYTSENSYYLYDFYFCSDDRVQALSEQEVLARLAGFVDVDMVLSSGKKLPVRDIRKISND